MSDIAIEFDPQFWAFVISFAVAVLGTPAVWRATRGMKRLSRIAVVFMSCIGLTALLSVAPTFFQPGMDETPLLATLCSAMLQTLLLPFLFLLPRKT